MTRHEEVARGIVQEHIDWHRHGRPRPTGGFPPEFFADELQAAILTALREAEAAGAARENEAVVAWLRDRSPSDAWNSGMAQLDYFANAIEAGDHRSRQSPEGE